MRSEQKQISKVGLQLIIFKMRVTLMLRNTFEFFAAAAKVDVRGSVGSPDSTLSAPSMVLKAAQTTTNQNQSK